MATVIKLDPTSDAAVRALVEGGHFTSADDVVRAGVKLVQQREARLAELDAAIARGLADSAAGRVSPAEEVRERLLERYRNWPSAEA